MSRKRIGGGLAAFAAVLASCQPDESRDLAFRRVLPLCNELFLPGSMASPPGMEVGGRSDELLRQIREHAAEFSTPAGVRYLRGRLDRETDDVARECIRRLLDDLREDAA
jgi:hypothetical protein